MRTLAIICFLVSELLNAQSAVIKKLRKQWNAPQLLKIGCDLKSEVACKAGINRLLKISGDYHDIPVRNIVVSNKNRDTIWRRIAAKFPSNVLYFDGSASVSKLRKHLNQQKGIKLKDVNRLRDQLERKFNVQIIDTEFYPVPFTTKKFLHGLKKLRRAKKIDVGKRFLYVGTKFDCSSGMFVWINFNSKISAIEDYLYDLVVEEC